jgi:alpha-glucosidase
MYYGEEIGLTNVAISPEEVKDPAEKNQPGIGLGRDPERTPMPWDDSPLAGFTAGLPWLPLGADHGSINVEALRQDKSSIFHLYRKMIASRRIHPALVGGAIGSVVADGNLLRYERSDGAERFLVLLNLGRNPIQAAVESGTIVVDTGLNREGERVENVVKLRDAEGLLIKMGIRASEPGAGCHRRMANPR